MIKRDKICDIITKFFINKGITLVTGYSGGANLPLLNSFYTNKNSLRFLKTSNEQCAGHVIEGYTKSLGNIKPGLLLGTSGPGVTNTITPLQNAYCDGTPLFLISGQVGSNFIGSNAFQECDAISLTKSCTKDNHILSENDDVCDVLHYLYNLAMEPRYGPVHLDIPKDILMREIEYNEYHLYNEDTNLYEIDTNNTLNELNKLVNRINLSEKPFICIGQGSNNCNIHDFLNMIEYLNIPHATTLHAMGCTDTDHHLNLGMMGMHGSAAANYAIQEADLIIGLGNRFDDRTIGLLEKYAPGAINKFQTTDGQLGGIFHIDNSNEQLYQVKQNFSEADYLNSIHTDVNKFVQVVLSHNVDKYNTNEYWINRTKHLKAVNTFEYDYSYSNLKTQDIIKELNNFIENNIDRNNIIYTTGVGNHQMFTSQYIRWTYPNSMITSGSLGTMGVGVPFAIGSQLAHPDKTVICIDGDGSFCMTSTELQTVAEHSESLRGLKIFIMNDGYQSMVKTWQDLFFDGNFIGTENCNPDFVTLAESHGIRALRCKNRNELYDTFIKVFECDEPILVDFYVDYDICLPLVSPGKAIDEMITYKNINFKKNKFSKKDIPN